MSTLATPMARSTPQPDAFERWWTARGEWVEAPNERRNGWSGVVRANTGDRLCYIKRQRHHLCHSIAHPFGWPTASREAHFLKQVGKLGLQVPEIVFHGTRASAGGTEAVLVTRALEGYAPLSAQTGLNTAQQNALAIAVGRALGVLHRARLQHGCLYDKHIMVRWHGEEPEVALLDLEKMRSRFTSQAAARRDLDQLRRHQTVLAPAAWRRLIDAHRCALSA
ncbi:MAG: lipopolysaccharide kinase InaA family protein [Azoarcus sp.]|nr:lipopolysaccharide kinase InaA family protein [Azoarcus sp.]